MFGVNPILNKQLFIDFKRGMITNYIIGSLLAVFGVGSVLMFNTLELTYYEGITLFVILLLSLFIMIIFELIIFRQHIKPIQAVFDEDELPRLENVKRAFVQTATFPVLTFKRIMGPHLFGLSVPATIGTIIAIRLDYLHFPTFYIVYAWFGAILIAIMHALIEFFLSQKTIQPILMTLIKSAEKNDHYELKIADRYLVKIKRKILYSSLFLAIYPLFLFSIATQIQLAQLAQDLLLSQFWHWAGIILVAVASFAIYGSILLFRDIKRPMEELEKGFSNVQEGNYQKVDNSYTDEFTKLITGFNHMVSAIEKRDEINKQLLESFFTAFATTLDARDPYTAGHSLRVASYAVKLGKEIGLDPKIIVQLKKSALLHDIGKIGVPDHVLLKDGKLTNEEFELIKRHPTIGEMILNQIQPNEEIAPLIPGVKHHHERYDGNGYPNGLKGEDIPMFGRILAVADAFDAMTSDRPYRKGMPFEKALSILENGKGTQWDPYYVQVFIKIIHHNQDVL
ncbi:HD domain-containing protein [Bacillus sp. YZJH907-2]|uniref:HD domain-containing protein n=2 Tax=Halalkalibacter suaedae TaxID=2822140 RepID=A0A941ARZ1_9BACI|nr:HD domain-containing protein [Bacillus suaedae]